LPPAGSQRSLSKICRGVPAGTVPSTLGTGPQSAELLPSVRSVLVGSLSADQSGPESDDPMAGPPALIR